MIRNFLGYFLTRTTEQDLKLFWTGKRWTVSSDQTKFYPTKKNISIAKSQLLINHPEFKIKINEA